MQTCAQNANLCKNGASCNDIPGVGISCTCGWLNTGTFCDQQRTCSLGNPCTNGATCNYVSNTTGVVCTCASGWSGQSCTTQNRKISFIYFKSILKRRMYIYKRAINSIKLFLRLINIVKSFPQV